jgi:N-acetylneuraminic acid mutarotase
VLDTETLVWETLTTEGIIPPARRNPIIWTHNNRLHTFGEGLDIHAMSVDNHRWAAVQTLGEAPSRRKYHSCTLVRNRLIVYGGSDGHTCFGELYMLDMESLMWSQVRLPMHPRLAHSTTLVGSYLFVIGGHDGGRYLNEVHLLNLVTLGWETRKVAGRFPNARGYHSATLADSRIFMLGGYDGETVFDELWVLDLSAQAYLPQITSFEIALDF